MGTTIWVRGRNTAPKGLIEVRGKTRAELAKVRAAPDTAALIVRTKVPTRFYSVASAYRPKKTTHEQNDATQVKCFKQMVGTLWQALAAAFFATWKQGGLQLQHSEYLWMSSVGREWVRNQHRRRGTSSMRRINTWRGSMPW